MPENELESLQTLLAVTKYMQAITLLAEAFENSFVAEVLAPACTEAFLTDSSLSLAQLEAILCTTTSII